MLRSQLVSKTLATMKQNLENENGQRSIMDSNNNIENGGEERRHMSVSSDEVNYLIYRYVASSSVDGLMCMPSQCV